MPNHEQPDARCGCALSLGQGQAARPFAFASSPRHFERDRPYTVRHLALAIELDVPKKSLHATATLDVERVDGKATEIVLDAIGFVDVKVKVDGKNAAHAYDGKQLPSTLGKAKQAKTSVTYAPTRARGTHFI